MYTCYFLYSHVYVCVCVCICVRACVRACVCACVYRLILRSDFSFKFEFVEERKLSESQSYLVITEQSWYKLLCYQLVNSAIKISLLTFENVYSRRAQGFGWQYDPFADAEEIEVDEGDEVDEVTKSKKQNTTYICNFTTYTKKSPNT